MNKECIYQAFLHFYHQDCANAAIHMSAVRFSPITFRLAELIKSDPEIKYDKGAINPVDEVNYHLGQYEEDKGR